MPEVPPKILYKKKSLLSPAAHVKNIGNKAFKERGKRLARRRNIKAYRKVRGVAKFAMGVAKRHPVGAAAVALGSAAYLLRKRKKVPTMSTPEPHAPEHLSNDELTLAAGVTSFKYGEVLRNAENRGMRAYIPPPRAGAFHTGGAAGKARAKAIQTRKSRLAMQTALKHKKHVGKLIKGGAVGAGLLAAGALAAHVLKKRKAASMSNDELTLAAGIGSRRYDRARRNAARRAFNAAAASGSSIDTASQAAKFGKVRATLTRASRLATQATLKRKKSAAKIARGVALRSGAAGAGLLAAGALAGLALRKRKSASMSNDLTLSTAAPKRKRGATLSNDKKPDTYFKRGVRRHLKGLKHGLIGVASSGLGRVAIDKAISMSPSNARLALIGAGLGATGYGVKESVRSLYHGVKGTKDLIVGGVRKLRKKPVTLSQDESEGTQLSSYRVSIQKNGETIVTPIEEEKPLRLDETEEGEDEFYTPEELAQMDDDTLEQVAIENGIDPSVFFEYENEEGETVEESPEAQIEQFNSDVGAALLADAESRTAQAKEAREYSGMPVYR